MSIFTSAAAPPQSPLASFSFPRTGKRGVPQQFPRRLYEMLENETKLAEQSTPSVQRVISWSDSGKAFRIFNVAEFANTVLPKYFRTKKFSSFQRNLNLVSRCFGRIPFHDDRFIISLSFLHHQSQYGFAKVRRGPETDMYAHPSFLRNEPEGLLNLRKVSTSTRKASNAPSKTTRTQSSRTTMTLSSVVQQAPVRAISPSSTNSAAASPPQNIPTVVPASPPSTVAAPPSPKGPDDRGRLDLLAFALEHEAFVAM